MSPDPVKMKLQDLVSTFQQMEEEISSKLDTLLPHQSEQQPQTQDRQDDEEFIEKLSKAYYEISEAALGEKKGECGSM